MPGPVRLPQRQQSDPVADAPCHQCTAAHQQLQQYRGKFRLQQPQPTLVWLTPKRQRNAGAIPFRSDRPDPGKWARWGGPTAR
jgi:hypothetical protein